MTSALVTDHALGAPDRLDMVKVGGSKPATHVQVGGHQSHPMHDPADTPNDHEFYFILQEPLQERFIVLDHGGGCVHGLP
jgi:hypothetical protein